MDSLEGQLLIASPHLADGNFNRSVVLIIHHNDEGAFGVVLNRPTTRNLTQLLESAEENLASDDSTGGDAPIYSGGPGNGPLMSIHTQIQYSENEVLPGIYFAASKDNLLSIVHQTDHPFRLYCGYAGWGTSQLEDELKKGAWLTSRARFEHIFERRDEELWNDVSRQIGDEIVLKQLNINRIPGDPSVN